MFVLFAKSEMDSMISFVLVVLFLVMAIVFVSVINFLDAVNAAGGLKKWWSRWRKSWHPNLDVSNATTISKLTQSKENVCLIWVVTFEAQIKGYNPIFKQIWMKGSELAVKKKAMVFISKLEKQCLFQVEKCKIPTDQFQMKFVIENKYSFDRHSKRRQPEQLFEIYN